MSFVITTVSISVSLVPEIPFCSTFVSQLGVLFVPAETFDVFGVTLNFFVGEIVDALAGDFPIDVRVFVVAVGVPETRPTVLGDGDTPEREICLLTVSLLCLSIDGDFTVIVLPIISRDLGETEVGAVLGLVVPVVVLLMLVGCFDGERDVLADVDLVFDVLTDSVVFVVVDDVLTSVVFAIVPLEVFAATVLTGLAAAVFPADFASLLVADFFSTVAPALDFDDAAAATVVFGFVKLALRRGETFVVLEDAATVVVDVVVVVVFAAVVLLLVLETVALLVPSSCLGRAAEDFFAVVDCVVVARTVVLTFEGEVGEDFIAGIAFVVVVLLFVVGRFAVVEDVAFVFVAHAVTAAVVAVAAATAAAAPVICFFNLSAFATSFSGGASTICCTSISFSVRISSKAALVTSFSICSCLIELCSILLNFSSFGSSAFFVGSSSVCSTRELSVPMSNE